MDRAIAASQHSYAPNSHFHVGAAIRTATDIYDGANFENDSYGATICAERAAVGHAIAHEGVCDKELAIVRIALHVWRDPAFGPPPRTVSPCGICRQVLYQFAPTAPIDFLENGVIITKLVQDLLPFPFTL
jgi:cytidine deaminase